jgi:hypothetical protein
MKVLAWMTRNTRTAATAVPAPRCRLIVLEDGTQGANAIGGGDWEETIVVSGQRDEPPSALAGQVAARVSLLRRENKGLRCAELFVAPRFDGPSLAARELVSQALLTGLVSEGAGELVVVADDAESEARDELLGLVSSLLPKIPSQTVTIRVQFHRTARRGVPH